MRYADRGSLTAERRAAREGIRLEAGRRSAQGDRTSDIAKDLRVSERSVEQWRRNWREGGVGLRSKGPSKLSDERFALLEEELAKGPAVHGWEDQQWTPQRVRTLIGHQFQVSSSIAGVLWRLHRHGWSWQCPARRALVHDEHAVEVWKKDV